MPPTFEREEQLLAFGYGRVCGVDEAGRGPLAGPVVAGAVVLDAGFPQRERALLNDSKQITAEIRQQLFEAVCGHAHWGVGHAGPDEIDVVNIRQASWLAMKRAVAHLTERYGPVDYVLIDGLGYGAGPWPYDAVVKGDACCQSIAAASIIAKVTRDGWMRELDATYPGYGFAQHKGYAVPQHLLALQNLGPCEIHRKSFEPVKSWVRPAANVQVT